MRVLVFAQQWEPEDGTPQRRWAQLTSGLIRNGHSVEVVTAPPHYPGGQLTSDRPEHAPGAVARGSQGETVWRTKFRPHGRSLISRVADQAVVAISSVQVSRAIIKAERPDIILTTAPPIPSAFIAAAVAKWHRLPYIIDLRDVWPDLLLYMNEWGNFAEANPRNRLKSLLFDAMILAGGKLFTWALVNADGIVTTTPSFAEKLRSEGFTHVLNVRNMASVRARPVPSLKTTAFLTGKERPDGSLRILYAGTTGRAQGLDSALEALRLTVEAGVGARMRVVGSGAHLRLLELHAQRDRLPVEFLHRIPFEEVREQYRWSDTSLIHLRSWKPLRYTVPSKLYEALSIGRHVTVAANGETARIITETEAGDAVAAMDPSALAALWTELANDRDRLEVYDRGRQWLLDRETPEENSQKFVEFVTGTLIGRRKPNVMKRSDTYFESKVVKAKKNTQAAADYLSRTVEKVPLLSRTIARMLMEDPVLFAVQTSRRLPKKFRGLLSGGVIGRGRPSVGRAFVEFITDHPGDARKTLRALETRRTPKGRVEGELRTQLSMSAAETKHVNTRARSAWAAGNISTAAELAGGMLRNRFVGEQTVHAAGKGIILPAAAEPVPSADASDNLRVFHFLTNSLPWTRSGYTFRSQSILEAQQNAGIKVQAATRLAYPTLIGRPWAGADDTVTGITYKRLEPRSLPAGTDQRLAFQAELLREKVAEFGTDVLHTTTNFHNALTVDAVARALHIPWVYEMRGNMEQSWLAREPKELQDKLLQSERYLSMRARETEMAQRANHVVVLSETQRFDMILRGVSPDKISVIPNSVDSALLEIPRDPNTARNRLGIPEGFWIGSVTAVVDYEGLPVLLEAVSILRDRNIPVSAAIVGDGVALPALKKQAADLEIAEHVLFPGRLPQEEALRWYQALDVFTIPRLNTEVTRSVTPIKGLQAMALGVPLVVSDLPALVEVGSRDGQGIAVVPEDPVALAVAVEAIYRSDALQNRMSTAGREAAAHKTWTAAAEKYKQIYTRLT